MDIERKGLFARIFISLGYLVFYLLTVYQGL